MTIIDVPQRSEEWFAARLGRVTGSRAKDVIATIKSGEAAARRDYRFQLVTERLTGYRDEDGFVSKDMQRGTDLEPEAFAAYEALTGNFVRRTGFVVADDCMAGCSLDGDVQAMTGIVEIKCPKSATHFGYIKSGEIPSNHLPQMIHNLWITGAQWCDFVSYDDRFPDGLQLVVIRYKRLDAAIADYAAKVREFLSEVERDEATARERIKAKVA
jgi:putative phage-type endonuclease